MTKFIAYDGAEYRVDRLVKAARIAADLTHLTPPQFNVLVESMTDDRGTLVVLWTEHPSSHQKDMFSLAWELCKEDPQNVRHMMDFGAGAQKV